MNKTKILNCRVVALLAVFLGTAFAGMAQGWATVDMRILMMFHPQMSGFDYSNGRFFRENAQQRDFDKVINQLKSAREKADKQGKELQEEKKRLASENFMIMQQLTRLKTGLAAGDLEQFKKEKAALEAAVKELDRQKPPSREAEKLFAARKVDLRDRISILAARISGDGSQHDDSAEKALSDKKESIVKRLAEIDAAMEKIEDEALAAVYLTGSETEKRLHAITSEINSLIKQAANEMKVAVVMDTSFAMRTPKRKDKMKMIPAVDESPDVVSSSLFHSFDNLSIDPAMAENLKGPDGSHLPPEHLIVGRALGMQSNLTQYLEFRNYMPERVAGFSTGRLFLSGGTDLTSWVARKLFDRYKVPDSVKNSFMLTLRRYLDFEKDPDVRDRDY